MNLQVVRILEHILFKKEDVIKDYLMNLQMVWIWGQIVFKK